MLENTLLRLLENFYNLFIKIGCNLQSLFLLYMRVTWGHQFFLAGINKLNDIPGTVEMFQKLNIPSPVFHAYQVGILEAVGGILLIIGLASRLATIPLIIILMTALSTAHAEYLAKFRFILDPHILVIQEPYPFLLTSLLIFIFGPGRISLDAWIKRWVDHQPRY